MQGKEHHIQDALEHLAVAMLQEMAENAGLALTRDSAAKHRAFRAECAKNDLSQADFASGVCQPYRLSLETHLPTFFERLTIQYQGERFDFVCDEKDKRNKGLKGDFEIRPERSPVVSVSLKNYRRSADRPQFNAQTFNTFALSFLFPKGPVVGSFIDTSTRTRFTARTRPKRDQAMVNCGYQHLVPYLHELDALQDEIRKTFVGTPEWEFLDEARFDPVRKRIGLAGAQTMKRFLDELPTHVIKERLLKMAGLDGAEAVLIMDPRVMAESVTDLSPLRRLHKAVQADACSVHIDHRGQSLFFALVVDGKALVTVNVPHTINKNGAWIDDEDYIGGKMHKSEKRVLEHLQRRPRKSTQISTSINTYMDLRSAGIFVGDGRS